MAPEKYLAFSFEAAVDEKAESGRGSLPGVLAG